MNIQKISETFKITIILYLIVLLLAINFYFIHTSYLKMQDNSETFIILYITSALSILFTLYIIYFVRLYIEKQIKKHAIHDHETNLFNKRYFLTECKSTHARAVRHEYPLSLLKVEIEGFEKGSTKYDKSTRLNTLKAFGTLLHSLTRDGDLTARYDENIFLILLPFTDKENALLFEKRIGQSLMHDDCIISQKVKLNFTITEFNREEKREEFIQRTLAT